ncbi:metallopeptidase MepB [Aureobasidium subglaciale]|nr:metallopeptidase MepB [Aureobasidium subglaciale]
MTTNPSYGIDTPGSQVSNDFSSKIKNSIVLITGVSPKSIGQKLAINISQRKPRRIVLASRTSSKLNTVVTEIRELYPDVAVDTVILDLSSQASIRGAVDQITKLVDRIDILINNAAVVDSELSYTKEGIEMQFGVGHVGHFLFTTLLLPLLEVSAKGSQGATRVINVSSEGHRIGPVRFHDYNFEGKEVPEEELSPRKEARMKDGQKYSVWVAYGQTKSANILFSLALNDRFGAKGIRSYAVHPGAIQTDLSRSLSSEDAKFLEKIVDGNWITLDQGTSTILVAALDPALSKSQRSVYMSNCQFAEAAPYTHDLAIAKRLWDLSEKLTSGETANLTIYADFEIETNTDQRLFDLVAAVAKKNEVLGAEDQRLLNRSHRNFVRNGLGVSPEQRDRFKDIQKALHQLTSDFQKNLREGSKGIWFVPEALAGVPEDMISTLTKGKDDEEGKVLLKFSSPHMSTIMRYAMNSGTRRDYFIASENKCLQNVSVFKQIVILRQEAAQILGYTNHAAFRIEDKMAKTPKAVMGFLDDLHSKLSEGAKSDVEGLKELKRKDLKASGLSDDGKMYLWDWVYYNRLMLETQHSVNRQEIAEYFPLQTTVAGVMDIYSRLFGLVFEELRAEDRGALFPTDQGSDLVWQEDVRLFAVWDDEEEGSSFLGYLYLDLFPRAGKYGGMCNMNLQCGFEKQDGSHHYPATALICNFTKPTVTKPSLLTHDEVQLFFHELGHGIHDLVAKTKFSVFHGTATVDDFCEAPSQMLEFWCWVPELLRELSCHYSYLSAQHLSTWQEENPGVEQPAKHIPLDMIEKLTKKGNDWGHGYANFDALVRVYDAGFYGYL